MGGAEPSFASPKWPPISNCTNGFFFEHSPTNHTYYLAVAQEIQTNLKHLVTMFSPSHSNITSRKRSSSVIFKEKSSSSSIPPLSPAQRKSRRTPLSPLPVPLPSTNDRQSLSVSFDASVSSPKEHHDQANNELTLPTKPFHINLPSELHLSAETLKSAFSQMVSDESSHQYSLHTSKCNQLSLSEVIIPSMFRSLKKELKKMQGRAKGRRDLKAVEEIKMIRIIVKSCEKNAILAVDTVKEERNEMNKAKRIQEKKEMMQRKEERQREKIISKEQKKHERQKRKQEKKEEARRQYGKNQELWREVAGLMTDLTVLQREEKVWKDTAKEAVEEMEKDISIMPQTLSSIQGSIEILGDHEKGERLLTTDNVQSIVDTITLSANRICETLNDIVSKVDEAKSIQDELYERYKKDFKLKDYFGSKADKALIRFLTM
jgi:hypothetical protein